MYIEPNSTLQLYKDMVLDKTYNNTLWFADINAQNAFFGNANRIAYEITKMSYQRKSRGSLKVELNIGQIYDVNYMRFKNDMFGTPYSTKWFYAFVDSVEYVSNTACYVNFTIDVIQTYMFDWVLNECLIERQHSVTDVAGDNLEIESLELGDVINNDMPDTHYVFTNVGDNYPASSVTGSAITKYSIIVAMAYGTPYTPFPEVGSYTEYDVITSGLPTGINYIVFEIDRFDQFMYFMYQIGQYVDSVISVTVMPTDYVPPAEVIEDDMGEEYVIYGNSLPRRRTYSVAIPTNLDGYLPMNKKLLTYPYCYLEVYNDQNQSIDLKYELVQGNSVQFSAYGIMSSVPEIVLSVDNYDRGEVIGDILNPKYMMSISGFPQVSYSNDAYKAWLAMNYDQRELRADVAGRELDIESRMTRLNVQANNLRTYNGALGSIGGIMSTAMSAKRDSTMASGVFGSIQGFTGSILEGTYNYRSAMLNQEAHELDNYKTIQGLNAEESRARKLPATPSAGTSSSAVAIGTKGFFIQKKSIRGQFAMKIDKFFNMFGYAINKVGVPNIHARSRYTYIKTNSSNVTGSIPSDDKDIINEIFNKGIRFWVASDIANFGIYPEYVSGVVTNPNNII